MSEKTKISWCDSTVNFWSGCHKVSPGCANCYAERLSKRNQKTKAGERLIGEWGPDAKRKLHEPAFKLALKLAKKPWVCDTCGEAQVLMTENKRIVCARCKSVTTHFHRRRIFSLSLGDWLDPQVPIEWLARMLDTIRRTPECDYLLVTKRPELFTNRLLRVGGFSSVDVDGNPLNRMLADWHGGKPPPNVWIIATVENQEMADKRIPELLKIPALVHGLSVEPMLGPIDLRNVRWKTQNDHRNKPQPDHYENVFVGGGKLDVPKVDWVIVGGESGPKARSCDIRWIRSVVEQCKAANTACFVKQLGARPFKSWDGPPGNTIPEIANTVGEAWTLSDSAGADPSEWPEDLRIQEWPK